MRVPAKINLQLAVGPLRDDGYHDLVTVYQAVSLYEEITVTPADSDSLSVTGADQDKVPTGSGNLALRAVAALRDATMDATATPVHVRISKHIPVAAGLAGGSADAAGALVACNELWGTGLTSQQLCTVAAGIGSDVPFAVLGGTVVGRGRGEELTAALVPAAQYHWVLAFANGQLATPEVYAMLDRLRTGQDVPAAALDPELMTALRAGDPIRVGKAISNDLQPAALSLFPALRKTLEAGREFGALGTLVSGSGPTCLFLSRSRERALALAASLSGAGVCRSVQVASGPVPGASVLR